MTLSMEHDSVLILTLSIILYFVIKPQLQINQGNRQLQLWLVSGFTLLCLSQSLYGIMQYLDIVPRLQEQFKIGGAFGNPGPYSNFFAASVPFPIALILITSKKESTLKMLCWIALLASFVVLPLTKARSAWIAAFIGVFFLLYIYFGWKDIVLRWFWSLWLKLIAIAGILLVVALLSLYLFKFKEQSASGRLFIWKITIEMIKDKPLFGFGFDQYMAAHNTYQAVYFKTGEYAKQEAELADSVNYAFNEYLQVTAETGIIGLLLLLLVVYYSFSELWTNKDQPNTISELLIAARASVLAILVSSLFSYPLRTIPTNVLLFLMLAIISANDSATVKTITFKERNRKLLSLGVILILVLFTINQTGKYSAAKEWLNAFQLVRAGNYEEAQNQYSKIYPGL